MLTTQELINNANSRQPDNSNGEISAADVREQNKDVAVSSFNKVSDKHLIGLKNYDPSRSYEVGEAVTYDNGGGEILWRCTEATTGAFNPSKWVEVGSGATSYSLSVDPSKTNGLEVLGTNPQTVGIAVAAAGQNGALSATDWAEFKAKQAALGFTPINVAEKGIADGVAPLDSSGVVAFVNLPASLSGALDYKGVYNATINSPAITDAGGSLRQYYVVSEPGTQDFGSGSIQLLAGDFLIHDGSKFDHVSTQGAGIESVQGDTSSAIDLGNGTENKLVAWKPGNKFKEVDIYSENGRLGIGVLPSFSIIDFAIKKIATGFSQSESGGDSLLDVYSNAQRFVSYQQSATGEHVAKHYHPILLSTNNNSNQIPLLELAKSLAAAPQIRLAADGTAPTNPQPGDIWSTSAGLFYRYGTQTINLTTGGGGGGNGVPGIGNSQDGEIVIWDGVNGNAFKNSNVKFDSFGNLIFQVGKGINGNEAGSSQSQFLFGTGVATAQVLPLPEASHFMFVPTAVEKQNFPSQINGQLAYDTTSLWFRHNNTWVDLLSTGGGGGSGDMLKSVYDTSDNGIVDKSQQVRFKAQPIQTIQKGNLVYAVGRSNITGNVTVGVADNTISFAENVIGMAAESGASGSEIEIVKIGHIDDIDTSAFQVGTILYLSQSGAYDIKENITTGAFIPVAYVVNSSFSNGMLVVDVLSTESLYNDNIVNRSSIPGRTTKDALENLVQTIVPGSNVAVNNSDPQNPVVSAFPTTTAGLLSRTYFTADTETLSAGTFFKSNRDGKGTATTATQTVTVNDNEKEFFAQDLISEPYPIETTIYAGSYSGILNGTVSAASAEQKFYVEIYLTDANGTPISSGITGAQVGDLGVEVVAIAESGLIDIRQADETQFAITAELTGNLILSTSNRIRYHVAAEKSGAAGGEIDISISYGSNHVAHLDIPIPSTTNTVINTDAATFLNEATQYDVNRKLNTDKVGSTTTGEPTGATVIGNIVEISQTDYDNAKSAGSLNATTLYLTPDA